MADKLMFPIGFDLEKGVKQAQTDWENTYHSRLNKLIGKKPIDIKLRISARGFSKDLNELLRVMRENRHAINSVNKALKDQADIRKKNAQATLADNKAKREALKLSIDQATKQAMINKRQADAAYSEERLAAAKRGGLAATKAQNAAYATQEGLLRRAIKRMAAYMSIHQAMRFLKNIVEVTAQFEMQRVSLGSIIGDLGRANEMFGQIKQAAMKSPFQIKELTQFTKQLSAYKIETDQLFETTMRLADVSAGLGVSMDRIILAYGQIRATGYLRATEVRQLTEAGLPIVESLAKKMSELRNETISAAQVMGMISERAISFGMVKDIFDDLTSAGGMFYKMQEKQAKTLQGQLSNLKDSFAIMYDEMGRSEEMRETIDNWIARIRSWAQNWQTLIVYVRAGAVAFAAYKLGIPILNFLIFKTTTAAMASKAYAAAITKQTAAMNSLGKAGKLFTWHLTASAKLMKLASRDSFALTSNLTRLGAVLVGNIWTIALAALVYFVSKIVAARKEANRLRNELDKIGRESAIQADAQARGFERLAKAIRESANGSKTQRDAIAEMKRAYGEFLPMQDDAIINLSREKAGYEAVTQAIREKVAMQAKEQKMSAIQTAYTKDIAKPERNLIDFIKQYEKVSEEEANRFTIAVQKAVSEGRITRSKKWVDNVSELNKIAREQLGKDFLFIDEMHGKSRALYEGFVEVAEKYETQIRSFEDAWDAANSTLGRYYKGYKELQKAISDTTGTEGERYSYLWNESKVLAQITKYNEYISELLSRPENQQIKYKVGDIINFDDLYKAIGTINPQLRAVVAKVQKEYEKLVSRPLEQLIEDQFVRFSGIEASKIGIGSNSLLTSLQNFFKPVDKETQDWVKTLKERVEDLEDLKFDNTNLIKNKQGDLSALEAENQAYQAQINVLKQIIELWDNSKEKTKRANRSVYDWIALIKSQTQYMQDFQKSWDELSKTQQSESALKTTQEKFSERGLSLGIDAKQLIGTREELLVWYDETIKLVKGKIASLGGKEWSGIGVEAILAKDTQSKVIAALQKLLRYLYDGMTTFDTKGVTNEMDKKLKDIADQVSRTKTAQTFFDKMLGLTGDRELSATLTMSVYGDMEGESDKLVDPMMRKIKEAEEIFKDFDLTGAIDKDNLTIDYTALRKIVNEQKALGKASIWGEEGWKNADAFVAAGEKANAAWLENLYKTYDKAMAFDRRRTDVAKEEATERARIETLAIDETEKKALKDASKKREAQRISAINLEEFKMSKDYLRIFEDIDHLSIPIIDRLIAKIKEFIANNKELSATDLKNLTEQIQKLEEGAAKKSPWFAGLGKGIKEWSKAMSAMSKAKKDTEEYEDAVVSANKAHKKVVTSLEALQNEFSQAQQLVDDFAGAIGVAEDSKFGIFLTGLSDALGAAVKMLGFASLAVKVFDGTIKSFLASNPIGWVLLIVSAVISAVQAIANAKVNRINREIESLQDTLDRLEYTYERLEKAQEKAFSSDYIRIYEQRLANLESQLAAYEKQLELEQSKGKKADDEKIKEYENAVRDAQDAITESQGEMSEYFLGTDLTSAARDFATAWIDAYKEFGNTTDAMSEKFQDMIENMVVESFAAQVMQQALDPIFQEIDAMSKDGVLDMNEAVQVAGLAKDAVGNIDVGMSNLMAALAAAGISVRGMGSELTGISRDIATASEESILGLAAGINTQNYYISQIPAKMDIIISLLRGDAVLAQGSTINLQDLVTLQNQHLAHLPNIAQNTADTVAECKAIVAETRRTADALERVIKPTGTQSTHKLNATLG